ncbi:hypothetical protein L9F63_000786 [Diploptera punctata]|uniref:tRNA (carboxymethyluridine(34)-5-O)-methyltransferase n=1 Tax=Diploptera punctata TaxID=6984 RepID=A0AAD8ALY7_DIPPU|nr:hypothetical protein L9F63_000786 [Diploptera punctata]
MSTSNLSMIGKTFKKKAERKQTKAKNILFRECGIHCSCNPTRYIMVANAGLGTGLQEEELLELCSTYGEIEEIVMLPGKSYCFIIFKNVQNASEAYIAINGKMKITSSDSGPLNLVYAEKVPEVLHSWKYKDKPSGLILLEDFVSNEEEKMLLEIVNYVVEMQQFVTCKTLKHRKVKHYGYEFKYDTNNVDKDSPLNEPLPSECNFLLDRLASRNCSILTTFPNQLTVNQYQPGQGIPPHVDTHSAFEDPILSLSLGSSVVMEFKNEDGLVIPILLRQRSLLIMSQESRYAWSHGITPRKMDIVPSTNGNLTIQQRGQRTSFTFRVIRNGECDCKYQKQCDSYQRKNKSMEPNIGNELAEKLETHHVHEVYEEIANHFSETRHKPWPNVVEFIQSLPFGSVLVDVGCGNGKYFGHKAGLFEIGCDRSFGLTAVCQERGFEVFNCNCLSIPLKSGIADGCISIAVIHHLATKERRLRAIEEIIRILQPDGKALIYVWAKDQERHKKSSYLKQDRKNRKDGNSESKPKKVSNDGVAGENMVSSVLPSLPVHTNRTQFQHHDLLVPWKLKPGQNSKSETKPDEQNTSDLVPTFYRYYHVFEEGELEQLCGMVKGAKIVSSYYDQGNWCIILQKS